MSKNIILLSDGTGNSASGLFKSNVWRLYQALDLTASDPPRQLAYHDDGVGTSSFKLLALIGGAFGWGLKRNVLDLYCFLSRHYREGDRIYGFGFSRGAFTIRVLTGLILSQGVVQAATERERRRLARNAYRAFRQEEYKRRNLKTIFRGIQRWLIGIKDGMLHRKPYDPNEPGRPRPDITFLGLWDTVAAYGLPFDELTKVLNWFFPLAFPDRNLNERVKRACHALALDDERHSFHPELWNEQGQEVKSHIDEERITQVWFAGMHSNVGGSYPDDGMALASLDWMMEQASKAEANIAAKEGRSVREVVANRLNFNQQEWKKIKAAANVHGKMYDSRNGVGGYYRYMPRKLEDLNHDFRDKENPVVIEHPKIHESVFHRIENRVDGYAPIVLPAHYAVVRADGTIDATHPSIVEHHPETEKKTWEAQREKVWRLVRIKRGVYFSSLLIVGLLVILPWLSKLSFVEAVLPSLTPVNQLLNTIWLPKLIGAVLGAVGSLLPGGLETKVKEMTIYYQQRPVCFSILALLYAAALFAGARLQQRIFDEMRAGWSAIGFSTMETVTQKSATSEPLPLADSGERQVNQPVD